VNLDNERINSFGRWQDRDGELVARWVVVNGFRDKADSYGQTRLRGVLGAAIERSPLDSVPVSFSGFNVTSCQWRDPP